MHSCSSIRLKAPIVPRLGVRIGRARNLAFVPRANVLTDVGKYLSEAASQIFHPQENDTPWKGSGTPFTGQITHHEEPARLRVLYEMTEKMRQEMEASGQVQQQAADAGVASSEEEKDDGSLQEYMTAAVARLFGHNFKGDPAEPEQWVSIGYSESWRGGSRRETQRKYDRLLRFQRVVKSTIENAEAAEKASAK